MTRVRYLMLLCVTADGVSHLYSVRQGTTMFSKILWKDFFHTQETKLCISFYPHPVTPHPIQCVRCHIADFIVWTSYRCCSQNQDEEISKQAEWKNGLTYVGFWLGKVSLEHRHAKNMWVGGTFNNYIIIRTFALQLGYYEDWVDAIVQKLFKTLFFNSFT